MRANPRGKQRTSRLTSKDFTRLQYLGLQIFKRLRKTSKDFKGVQRTSADFKRLQGTSSSFKRLHETPRDFKRLYETS
jgi:hypothetical protein